MTRPRAADDFVTIRARLVELRRERERAQGAEGGLQRDLSLRRGRTAALPSEEISTGHGRVRQSGLRKRLDRDRPWWARPE